MRKYRTWHEVLIEDLADPAEAIGYLDVSIEEYQIDGDTLFFLRGIQNVIEAQGGVATIAKQAVMSPETLSKILSSEDAPHLDTLATILKALGCRLSIEPLKDKEAIPDIELTIKAESPQLGNAETQLSEPNSSQ